MLGDVISRFPGTAAARAAAVQLATLPRTSELLEKVTKAAPYVAAGAGILLAATLLMGASRPTYGGDYR